MKLNRSAFIELFYGVFNGNFSRLAKELGLDVAYVYRVIERNKNCGVKFYTSLMHWCLNNNRDYREFITLP